MERYEPEEITVTDKMNPSEAWMRLRKKFKNKGFIAVLTIHNADALHANQRSRLQSGNSYPEYTLAIISVDDLRKIFRAVKRGNIKNPIVFLPPPR